VRSKGRKKKREQKGAVFVFFHYDKEEGGIMNRKRGLISILVVWVIISLWVCPAMAREVMLFGKPLTLLGYATQGAGVSLVTNDHYDTERGLQTALMNLFLEGDYKAADNLKFYTSAKVTTDWIYQIKANDASWNDKEFNKSKTYLNVDANYWQILNEAHMTLSPGNFMFRLGKQVVSWGEMDGFRVMDQINPLDGRRGFGDVEFENTIIPIWLLRSEFYPRITTKWLQDLALEFVLNFNADHIYNQDIRLGNDEGGIWSPNIRIHDPTAPQGEVHVGSAIQAIDQPGRFNHKGYEYAFRVKGVVKDTILTLNAFYGFDNSPITKFADPTNPFPVVTMGSDGKLILHPYFDGKYPRFRFIGATGSRDLPFLKTSVLGNVAPVMRLEGFYAYKNTFTDSLSTPPSYNVFRQMDEIRAAVGFDWKIKIPTLNQRAYFFISPQLYYRFVNLPAHGDWYDTALTKVGKHNYTSSLFINTMYMNAKLVPSFFWLHDFYYNSDFFRLQLTYDWSDNWRFTLGSLLFFARDLPDFKANNSFDLFTHKNQVFFKVTYKWQ
jgi:hypothetical protein